MVLAMFMCYHVLASTGYVSRVVFGTGMNQIWYFSDALPSDVGCMPSYNAERKVVVHHQNDKYCDNVSDMNSRYYDGQPIPDNVLNMNSTSIMNGKYCNGQPIPGNIQNVDSTSIMNGKYYDRQPVDCPLCNNQLVPAMFNSLDRSCRTVICPYCNQCIDVDTLMADQEVSYYMNHGWEYSN